ncbi:MAG: DUF4388 domain-containing protein [Acidobacteriota bacterium]|nr:DUF4388 domain-containing protein [Acidobacteriota bacterium]
MALTGHLSDLSLSELIEFFCNQRKTGQLKVLYPEGHGYFYLQTGSVVDARIGVLRGIDAVYYALTLPNAKFEFGGASDSVERTINQPWTQVVLEGLRRLDEGIIPAAAFPPDYSKDVEQPEPSFRETDLTDLEKLRVPGFLSFSGTETMGKRRYMVAGAVAVALVLSVAAIGFPAGWYARNRASAVVSQPESQPASSASNAPASSVAQVPNNEVAASSESNAPADHSEAVLAAKRLREKEKAKAREEQTTLQNQPATSSSSLSPANVVADSAKSGPKKVAVTVTYDESGRVTQASGGDASAIRIARQKRFPAGKAGSATITIPLN